MSAITVLVFLIYVIKHRYFFLRHPVDEWRMARVIPIYTSENRSKCENYRPISILPIISKVFEREVFNQIYRYLNENSLISKFQSGFRPKYGTVSALIQICDQWLTDMDNGKLNGVVFSRYM